MDVAIYFKSAAVGLLAVVLAAFALRAAVFVIALVVFRPDGIDFPTLQIQPKSFLFWFVVVSVFSTGFFWEFRRLSH